MSNKLIKPSNENKIIIDDGSKSYTIENKKGKKLGVFEFCPSDTNIVNRLDEVIEFFNTYKILDGEDGVSKAEKEIVEKISYLINADAEESFFKILGAFSALENGELYVENVLNAVAKVIEREFHHRSKKVQRRMNKYVAKYHN